MSDRPPVVKDAVAADDGRRGRTDILFVIGSLEMGGAERHLSRIVPALRDLGWEARIFTLTHPGALAPALQAQAVPICGAYLPATLRPNRGRNSVFKRAIRLSLIFTWLVFYLLRLRPRAVHFFLPASYLIGMTALIPARAVGWFVGWRPRLLMSRRSLNDYQRQHPLAAAFEKRLHRFCAAILGNSRAVIADLRREGAPEERLELIYNGLELTEGFSRADIAAARREIGDADSSLILIVVANLIPYKGHADLLEALHIALPKLPADWRLWLAGRDDGVATPLRQQAARLKIAPHIRLLGPRADARRLMAAADIGLLPSHQEGFSNAVLEGMAAGLPMIVSAVGGNPEAVVDGHTGLVTPPKDAVKLAAAIIKLAESPTLRKQMGQAGAKRVRQHFSLPGCVTAYDALYRKLLEKPGQNVPDNFHFRKE